LRLLRNPYVHAKAGLKNGSLAKKMIDEKFESVELLAKSDAVNSLSILKSFTDKNVIMWFAEEAISCLNGHKQLAVIVRVGKAYRQYLDQTVAHKYPAFV
jgi:hypothetical protein